MVTEYAYAKVNLTLHVTGQRADGYHYLDSLVAFTDIADRLGVIAAPSTSLRCAGQFGDDLPSGPENLVLRAARLFHAMHADFTLHKYLPPASGIGGGSADAAATIRALMRLQSRKDGPLSQVEPSQQDLLRLGADVPVCLMSRPARMRGIGQDITPVTLPPCWILLVNPRIEVPTPAVFKALASKQNTPMPETLPNWPDTAALSDWLRDQRNDLETPARTIAPVIGDVLTTLRTQTGALIARMSGSGATCFALFADEQDAFAAKSAIYTRNPDWWAEAGRVFPGAPEPVN